MKLAVLIKHGLIDSAVIMMVGMYYVNNAQMSSILTPPSYGDKALDHEDQIEHLSSLITTYLSFMDEVDVETWIMHGTLLAWWWNQKVGIYLLIVTSNASLTAFPHRPFPGMMTLTCKSPSLASISWPKTTT